MKTTFVLLLLPLSSLVLCQATAGPADRDTLVVRDAVVRALNFEQGNISSLSQSRTGFTARGWNTYLGTLKGFLDDTGAPTFTSKFVPAADPVIVKKEAGAISLKIPGTLTQTHGKSATTYRLRVDVEAVGNPPRIDSLEQVTCGEARAATYCM